MCVSQSCPPVGGLTSSSEARGVELAVFGSPVRLTIEIVPTEYDYRRWSAARRAANGSRV